MRKKKETEIFFSFIIFIFCCCCGAWLLGDCFECYFCRIWDENTKKALPDSNSIVSKRKRIFYTRPGHLPMTRTMNMHFDYSVTYTIVLRFILSTGDFRHTCSALRPDSCEWYLQFLLKENAIEAKRKSFYFSNIVMDANLRVLTNVRELRQLLLLFFSFSHFENIKITLPFFCLCL